MRSTLFTIPLNGHLDLGPLGTWPVFGPGLLLAAWVLLGLWGAYAVTRRGSWKDVPLGTIVTWCIVAVVLYDIPRHIQAIPLYGYGTMLCLGYLTATYVASQRLKNLGYDGEIAWDLSMWGLFAGVIGGRGFYVIQYHERFFGPDPMTGLPRSLGEILKGLVNLPDGGLVFYGGLIVGGVTYYLFCRSRKIRPLALADIVITSLFIGMTFGRIGCLLNGCCFGDLCQLPWGVTFPHGSYPFEVEVERGFLSPDATRSLPVHPTQIYSALNAGVLALLTWLYYPRRHCDGAVLVLGWLAYPVSRFVVEFLRGDEMGQFGTSLTISQWVSMALFATGMMCYWWIRTHAALNPLTLPFSGEPTASVSRAERSPLARR